MLIWWIWKRQQCYKGVFCSFAAPLLCGIILDHHKGCRNESLEGALTYRLVITQSENRPWRSWAPTVHWVRSWRNARHQVQPNLSKSKPWRWDGLVVWSVPGERWTAEPKDFQPPQLPPQLLAFSPQLPHHRKELPAQPWLCAPSPWPLSWKNWVSAKRPADKRGTFLLLFCQCPALALSLKPAVSPDF